VGPDFANEADKTSCWYKGGSRVSVSVGKDNKKTPRQAVPSILVAINICMKRYHL